MNKDQASTKWTRTPRGIRPSVRPDCELCHGTGLVRYLHVGQPLPKDGLAPKVPCPCKSRTPAPPVGKKGRRTINY